VNNLLPDSADESSATSTAPTPYHTSPPLPPTEDQELLRLRQQSISNSFQSITSRSSSGQTKFIFENLSMLRTDLKKNFGSLKRDLDMQLSDSIGERQANENMSPRTTNLLNKKLFSDASHSTTISIATNCSTITNATRPPLMPLDLNSNDDISLQQSVSISRALRETNRTAQKKEQRRNKSNT